MTHASQPQAQPELGALDKFLLTPKAQELLGWQSKQIDLLESRLDAGSRAYASMDRWVKEHGGPEIVENEEALAKSRNQLSKARKDLQTVRAEVAQFNVDLTMDSAGDFDRTHPAQDSIGLSGELRDLRTEIKSAVKDGSAVTIAKEADTTGLTPRSDVALRPGWPPSPCVLSMRRLTP